MSCECTSHGLTLRVFQVLVERLHSVLRPFLLRRLKRDVEKQLPGKHEHIIKCRLSKRQRTLYEDYMAASDVRSTLSSGNFLGIINVLMQLRKVCVVASAWKGPALYLWRRPALSHYTPHVRKQNPLLVCHAYLSCACPHGMTIKGMDRMSQWQV